MMIWHLARLVLVFFLMGTASSQNTTEPISGPINFGLAGQVVDATGRGMQGVTVWTVGVDGGVANAAEAINATTNVTGHYGFSVPPGNYTIMAELAGYSFTSSAARVWAENASVAPQITGYAEGTQLPPAQSIFQPVAGNQSLAGNQPVPAQLYSGYLGGGTGLLQGRIVDQSGAPIPMAAITIDGFRTAATSDEQGYYRINLNPGLHRVDASKAGYGLPPRVILVLSGQTSTLDLIGKRTVALGTGR